MVCCSPNRFWLTLTLPPLTTTTSTTVGSNVKNTHRNIPRVLFPLVFSGPSPTNKRVAIQRTLIQLHCCTFHTIPVQLFNCTVPHIKKGRQHVGCSELEAPGKTTRQSVSSVVRWSSPVQEEEEEEANPKAKAKNKKQKNKRKSTTERIQKAKCTFAVG